MKPRKGRHPAAVRHLELASLIVLAVLVLGVAGYMLIEDMSFTQALYMTVMVVSTVGFTEVEPLGTAGVYFTIFIMVIGVTAMFFFLAVVFEIVLSEYLGDIWGKRRMRSSIDNLRNHYIVCGYGRVGRSVAEELFTQGREFVVIERNPEVFQECVDEGYLGLLGSATDNETLVEAGIMRAVGLVSALRSDADNLYVVLTARTMNPSLLLVARADQPGSEEKLFMVGADRVVSPHQIAGKRMVNILVRPQVCEFIDVGVTGNIPEYQLIEYRVDGTSPVAGMTIAEIGLRERTGVTILAVRGEGATAFSPNPPADTRISRDDVLIMIGTPEQMANFEREQSDWKK
ncbi:MAG: potassium channel protein [Actinobacteria bacterium]|nr:potassium channel protein [Actinomycetota bacterium]MBU1943800.1 potassium channel protein [Actinomycetota bacterium]MBU2689039.1 potassium channel protein [Actinomycetota bacterium]